MTRPPAGRLIALFVGMALALGGLVVRLGLLQVRESGAYAALGIEQRLRTEQLNATRAKILDRSGSPLAVTLEARDVYVNPSLVIDPIGESVQLATLLGLKSKAVAAALATADSTFVYVARGVDMEVAARIADLALPGVGLLPAEKRYYPGGSIAAQVVGLVNLDGVGITGLEWQYDTALAGTPGVRTVELSAMGQEIAGGVQIQAAPQPGAMATTTSPCSRRPPSLAPTSSLRSTGRSSSRRSSTSDSPSTRTTREVAPSSSWIRGPVRSTRWRTIRASTPTRSPTRIRVCW